MSKKTMLFFGFTIVFVAMVVVLEVVHQTTDTVVPVVPADVTKTFTPTINTAYFDDLEARQQNDLGQDLEY